MNSNPFTAQAKGIRVACTTSASSSVALPCAGNVVRIFNGGTVPAYVSIGTGTQTATVPTTGAGAATCTVIPAGWAVTLSIPNDSAQNISGITGSGTANLDVYVGEGV